MQILKRLFVNSSEVNAVLLSDQGEEYPVFLESLHNTIFLPELIKSGYALASLPYNFVKNGVSFDSIPAEQFNPDPVALEAMFNAIGTPLSQEEIKSYIKPETAIGISMPATNYTITTREDFLKFLDLGMAYDNPDDFLPINYFVSPDACFTFEEYSSEQFKPYVDYMSRRRHMSLNKFRKLVAWLKTVNYSGGSDPFDVVDAYFAWGLDGLNAKFMSKHREERVRTKGFGHTSDVFKVEYGFVDGLRNIYAPHVDGIGWELGDNSQEYIQSLTNGLGADDLRVVAYYMKTTETVAALDGINIHMIYNTNSVNVSGKLFPTISVASPVNIQETLDLKLALPGFENDLVDYCKLVSIAKYINERRADPSRISSYDLYYLMGMNFKTTLRYIRDVSGKGGPASQSYTQATSARIPGIMDDRGLPDFTDNHINAYLDGTLEEDGSEESALIKEFFDSVFAGEWFDDSLQIAHEHAAMRTISSNLQALRALHYVFDMSYDDIYEKLRSATEASPVVEFTNGKITYRIDLSQSDEFARSFNADKTSYIHENIMTCNQFCYVLRVAREVAEPNQRRRHIAAEFLKVQLRKGHAMRAVLELEKLLLEEMNKRVSDPRVLNTYTKNIRQVTLTLFFEVARTGHFTVPAHWGEGQVPVPPSLKEECSKCIIHCIDTLESFCNTTVFVNGKRKVDDTGETTANGTHFDSFCVNAYVTPDYVIPRNAKTVIKEYPLFTLWYDWRRYQPETYQQLVNLGILDIDFIPWSCYDTSAYYVDRSINYVYEMQSAGKHTSDSDVLEAKIASMNAIDSISYYYDQAMTALHNWPADKEFTNVPYIKDYMYPDLVNEVFHAETSEEYEPMDVPRQGEPIVRLGAVKDIVQSDYEDIVDPIASKSKGIQGQYLKQFNGFNPESLMNSSAIIFKIPDLGKNMLVVEGETIFDATNKTCFDFRDIPNHATADYNFVNIYGRIWLFRTMNGSVWEAMI